QRPLPRHPRGHVADGGQWRHADQRRYTPANTWWRLLPARQRAGDAAGTPAALPPASTSARPGTAPGPRGADLGWLTEILARWLTPGPRGADLGRRQQPHADACHRTTRRGTNHETDADRQTTREG